MDFNSRIKTDHPIRAAGPTTDDLVALIQALATALNRENPNHALPAIAAEYLDRFELSASSIREEILIAEAAIAEVTGAAPGKEQR